MHEHTGTRRLVVVLCVWGLVIAGAVGAAGAAAGTETSTDDAPDIERAPVAFTAYDSGDRHIEVRFEESISLTRYDFIVQDSDGDTITEPTVNGWYSDPSEGYLWFDLAEDPNVEDLSLVLEDTWTGQTHRYDITSTDAFVQADEPTNTTLDSEGNAEVAVLNIPGRDPTDLGFEITSGSDSVAAGSTGSGTFATVVEIDAAEAETGLTVEFESGETVSVDAWGAAVEQASSTDSEPDDSERLPGFVESRNVETVTDTNSFEDGTNVPFRHGLGMGEIVLHSYEHTSEELTVDGLNRIPDRTVPMRDGESIRVSDPPGEFVTAANVYFEEGNEPLSVRLPVEIGQAEYGPADLQVVHYHDGTWQELNTTVVDQGRSYGYHQVTVEGHAQNASVFAVVARTGDG
jgi:hypothetical protein